MKITQQKPLDCRICSFAKGKKVEIGDQKWRTEWTCDKTGKVIKVFDATDSCPHV